MTKTNIQRFLFAALVTFSFVCFIYLNTINVEQVTSENTEIQNLYEEEEDPAAVSLPDVEMVRKMIEGSKKIIRLF